MIRIDKKVNFFIKVIKTLKRGAYNEEGKFIPWVMRISHNLVIDHFRKSNRVPTIENKEEFDKALSNLYNIDKIK